MYKEHLHVFFKLSTQVQNPRKLVLLFPITVPLIVIHAIAVKIMAQVYTMTKLRPASDIIIVNTEAPSKSSKHLASMCIIESIKATDFSLLT